MTENDAAAGASTKELLQEAFAANKASPAEPEAKPEGGEQISKIPAKEEVKQDSKPTPPLGRDEKGRFTKGGKAEKEPETPADKAQDAPAPETPPPVEEDLLDPIIPPRRLNAEQRAAFAKLPREQQQILADTIKAQEAHFTQGSQELAAVRKRYAALEETLAPYQSEIIRAGGDPLKVIATLFEWHKALKTDPQGAIAQLAQMYNAQLPASGQGNAQAAPQYVDDPRITQLEQTLAALAEQNAAAQAATLQSVVDAWKKETDIDGNPKWHYVDELEEDMARYIPGLKTANQGTDPGQILKKAYILALQDHPELEEAISKKKQALLKKKEIEEEKAAAEKAAKAGVSIKGSGGSAAPTAPTNTKDLLRGLLRGTVSP